MKKILIAFFLIPCLVFGQTGYQKDFDEFWKNINERYAYFEKQQIDWLKVKEIYGPLADTITNNADFIRLLESVINELHNGHSSLNVNLATSNRIVPSGSDIFVEQREGRFLIMDVRKRSSAELCGLNPGMEITSFNDKEVEGQLQKFLPSFTDTYTPAMKAYAIAMLFAGTHDKERKFTVWENGTRTDYFPDNFPAESNSSLIEYRLLNKNTGYIRINNSLGNNSLVAAFDKALDSMIDVKNMILDLTETPGGGNSTVARAIMGRFIDKKLPYQTHEYDEIPYETKRHWTEYVIPRKTTYKGRLVILVGHWTGSMGEGITIGFDGMKRATIIGTEMAGLIGAVDGFTLTETKIGFQIPTERLYHINGLPREEFKPKILTDNMKETWQAVKKLLDL